MNCCHYTRWGGGYKRGFGARKNPHPASPAAGEEPIFLTPTPTTTRPPNSPLPRMGRARVGFWNPHPTPPTDQRHRWERRGTGGGEGRSTGGGWQNPHPASPAAGEELISLTPTPNATHPPNSPLPRMGRARVGFWNPHPTPPTDQRHRWERRGTGGGEGRSTGGGWQNPHPASPAAGEELISLTPTPNATHPPNSPLPRMGRARVGSNASRGCPPLNRF